MQELVGRKFILGQHQYKDDGTIDNNPVDWFKKHIGKTGKIINVRENEFYGLDIVFDDRQTETLSIKEIILNLNKRID